MDTNEQQPITAGDIRELLESPKQDAVLVRNRDGSLCVRNNVGGFYDSANEAYILQYRDALRSSDWLEDADDPTDEECTAIAEYVTLAEPEIARQAGDAE